YDGQCGDKEYGENLPVSLGCKKILLDAGLSSQALFLGKKSTTLESLYISKSLLPLFYTVPKQMSFIEEFV
ncbi:MAG: DNA adenine methylase, partial [Planctomycetia bacterium]|nr:DNA adenine methylase [Planctomycetia bacterium]